MDQGTLFSVPSRSLTALLLTLGCDVMAQMEIREHVEKEIQGHQREAILRQQLKYIQQELGISFIRQPGVSQKSRARRCNNCFFIML